MIISLLFEAYTNPKVTAKYWPTMPCFSQSCKDPTAKDDTAAQRSACPVKPPHPRFHGNVECSTQGLHVSEALVFSSADIS